MALPEPFGGPSTGNREPPSYAGNASIAERNWLLLLAGLGELMGDNFVEVSEYDTDNSGPSD